MGHTLAFGFGEFLGNVERRATVDGFLLADIIPAVADRDVPRHTHDEAHFILVLEGLYRSLAFPGDEVREAPALVYNPPGTTHRDRFGSSSGRFLSISVAAGNLALARDQYRLFERPTRLAAEAAERSARLVRLLAEVAQHDRNSTSMDPIGLALIAEGVCWEVLAAAAPSAGQEVRGVPRWLLTVRDLLHDCCDEPLRLGAVAAAVGIHPIHLTRTFRRVFRCTPGDYLRRCRIERALTMLTDRPEVPLVEVALGCGFADQSHFCHRFRESFGLSPGAFRRLVCGRRSRRPTSPVLIRDKNETPGRGSIVR
jgi:AraC family transcriptional regulator